MVQNGCADCITLERKKRPKSCTPLDGLSRCQSREAPVTDHLGVMNRSSAMKLIRCGLGSLFYAEKLMFLLLLGCVALRKHAWHCVHKNPLENLRYKAVLGFVLRRMKKAFAIS
jgi:hypothetical protein